MVQERRQAFRCKVPPGQQKVLVALESRPEETRPGVLIDESATGFGVLVERFPVRADQYLLLRIPAGWVRTQVIHVQPQGDRLRVGLRLVAELLGPEEESPLEEAVPLVRGDRIQGLWSPWQAAVVLLLVALASGTGFWLARSASSLEPVPAQEKRIAQVDPQQVSELSEELAKLLPLEQQLAMRGGPSLLLEPEVQRQLALSPRQQETIRLLAQEAEQPLEPYHRLSLFLQAWNQLTLEQRRRWRQWMQKTLSE